MLVLVTSLVFTSEAEWCNTSTKNGVLLIIICLHVCLCCILGSNITAFSLIFWACVCLVFWVVTELAQIVKKEKKESGEDNVGKCKNSMCVSADNRSQRNCQEDSCLAKRKRQSPPYCGHHSGSWPCHCCQGYVINSLPSDNNFLIHKFSIALFPTWVSWHLSHHIQSSHAFKTVLKTHLYKQYPFQISFFLLASHPTPTLLLIAFLLYACVCMYVFRFDVRGIH